MRRPLPLLVFFANSSRDSNDGRRVREFRARVPCADESVVLYRDELGRLRSVLVLLRTIRRLRPDLVYVEVFGYSGVVGALLGKLLFGVTIGLGNGDHVFSTHAKMGHWIRAAIAGPLECCLRRYADLWVVWSPFYHRWLKRRGARSVVCAPGAVNLDVFKPADRRAARRALGLDEHALVVGVVGSLRLARRFDMVYGWDLIDALAELPPDLPVKGLIVGGGDGLERLRARARERAVEDRVVFTGLVPHADLPRYYAAMDVGLVTQSNDLSARFTWTAKLPELMACGVFPVMTDVEPSRRFVRRCGALLPFEGFKDPLYPQRLAALIRTLLEDPAQLERRRSGPVLAQGLMSYEVAARHLDRGIRRVLHASPRGLRSVA